MSILAKKFRHPALKRTILEGEFEVIVRTGAILKEERAKINPDTGKELFNQDGTIQLEKKWITAITVNVQTFPEKQLVYQFPIYGKEIEIEKPILQQVYDYVKLFADKDGNKIFDETEDI